MRTGVPTSPVSSGPVRPGVLVHSSGTGHSTGRPGASGGGAGLSPLCPAPLRERVDIPSLMPDRIPFQADVSQGDHQGKRAPRPMT